MVDTGTGMMAGKLEIRGTIDTKDLEKGFAKIEVGFSNVRKDSKATVTDLTKMDIIGKGLSRTFLAVGAAAGGMILEAARKAPALAGDMARIKVSWDSMIRSLGIGLAPVFDQVAGFMENMANWAGGHTDMFAAVIGGTATVTAIAGLLKLTGLSSIVLPWLAPLLGPIAVGTVLAGLIAVAGIAIGGALAGSQGTATPVPIGDAAKIQIGNSSTQERIDLQGRYTGDLNGPGGQFTPEIDPNTGRLVSSADVEQRIIQNAMIWLSQQNSTLSMRTQVMGQNNTYFNI